MAEFDKFLWNTLNANRISINNARFPEMESTEQRVCYTVALNAIISREFDDVAEAILDTDCNQTEILDAAVRSTFCVLKGIQKWCKNNYGMDLADADEIESSMTEYHYAKIKENEHE